ncbi:FRAS1-related extracellular matrix protein 1b isoform X2 [Colossoma macropomum]|uniref:FRAS1-related extracellular matrix protein 1b isoform X2 n=1 Tax=Colossoma macropomum TaxID=42526 RepID=UPI0018655C15|nr:FRAS1-related extracellular matrix protein 1b isoform X2 [Colossoma macropomum]
MEVVDFLWMLVTLSHVLPLGQTESVLRVKSGLQVIRGQSVSVTTEELQFNTDESSEACKVEVVLNEPVTQRVGKLTPQVFDCHFLPDEVKYVHNGSPLLEEDVVMLRVYRFTDSETFTETFLLEVQVLVPQKSLIEFGSIPLVVPTFYGLSNAIDSNVLTFRTLPSVICTVRLLSSEISVPMLGQMVTEDPAQTDQASEPITGPRKGRETAISCPGNKACVHNTREVHFLKTSCSEFLTSGLKYQHLSPPSPEIDYVPVRVELRDQTTRALLEAESIWLPVLIHGAMQNQPPHAAFMSMFILEVDQFILTPMTTAALDAKDDETPQAQLVFNVTKPPAEGYITHLDDHTKAVSSFSWQDLNEMKIAYQPPNSSHTNRRNYEVEFQAIDGFFATSAPIMVHISIRTAETNAPRVSWNLGLDLLEGQSRPITWENLQIVDNDNLDAVTLVAVDGPLHGRLSVRGGKGFMFKVKDLREGVVVYHHSDSDTTRDHIVFRIMDGRHSIRHKFPIYILPKDDTPPFLINNVAFEVQEGGSVLVEEYMLLASDLDSSDDYIQYQITTSPRAGELVKKTSPHDPGVPVTTFMQRDLFQGLIYYRHSGEEMFEDSFEFILSDIHHPPNLSDKHTVVIHVFPVKDQLPVEVSATVRSITVKETEVVYITQSHLHFRAPEHPDTDLMYLITQPCFSPAKPGLPDAGRLFYTESTKSMKKDAMVPVLRSFTQHAVTHHKVGYMPPIEDIGPEPLFVQFIFSVSDQQGGALTGLVFNITVTPVDNQAPEIFTNLLRVEEGGSGFLMEEHLLVRDADSPEEKLRVQVRTQPRHGTLELQGVVLAVGDSFHLQDLKALRVRYIHDDSETLKDSVGLTITDGINSAQSELLVQILPVNDEPPQLGSGLRAGLSCEEGSRVQITTEYLFATDADSDDTRLTYMLARTPARGVLQRDGVTVDKFSQLDVLNGLIFYLHTGGEIGPDPVSDTVTLIVSDGEGGTTDGCCQEDAVPPPVPLHGTLPVYDLNITVLPINNQPPSITIGNMLVVDEGSSVCLCGGVLAATDPDTKPEQLIFQLESPPQYGFLENTLPSPGFEKSNAGIRVVSFSQLHLTSGFINYVQSVHQGVEPTADHFTISVSDGVHKSGPVPLYVIINPTNDETPSLLLHNFTVMEGGIKDLNPAILDAVDLDAPSDILTITVLVPPAHGMLLNGIYGLEMSRYKEMGQELLQRSPPVQSFTKQALRQGMKIIYMHDDTETLKDSFTMQLTDGRHTVQGTAWVRILPVNDEKPRLLKNAGVEVEALDRRVISSVVLEAEDTDTPTDQLYYVLNASPRFGLLQLKTDVGWTDLNAGQNFTQEDVEMNRLWYKHTTFSGFKGHDRFHFFLTDTDNQTPPQSFFISVHTVPKGDIALITKPVTLMEGERVVLTTDVLMATDSGSRSDELIYTVTVSPKHGHLHMVQHPGVPLFTFTQMDVAAHRVCYTHDNSRFADHDSFSFDISNGVTSRSGSISFTVQHSDRIPPTLSINTGLQLSEGSTQIISPEHLQLTDPDTAFENLTYTLIQPPQYGKLLLKGFPLSQARFTQLDINNMQLSYQHLNSFAKIDRFTFQPSDGTNKGYLEYGQLREQPAVFTIQIEVIDKTPPRLVNKGTPSTVENLQDDKHGIYITTKELQASDPDSPDQELEFIITRPPHFGYLENAITGGYIKGRFTQKDVDQRAVRYVIPSDMEVTADSFEFQVKDPAGNTMLPEVMELRWSRVELTASCYRVCENAGTLAVQVMRSGNSADPAYVGIQVEEGTAKVGKDFTTSSASLIQFDPGVNVKFWNIYLKDDGLEENHEKLEVVLKAQKNVVLGPISKATVEIVDPRNGRCDPDDLVVEDDEKNPTLLHPPRIHKPPTPPPPPAQEEEYTPDPNTGIIWENHPPRGDVPYRTQFIRFSSAEPQDQAFFSQGRRHTRVLGNNRHRVRQDASHTPWLHSLIPLRPLEVPRVHPEVEVTPIWSWNGHSADIRSVEIPQRDGIPSGFNSAVQQHKSAKSVSVGCLTGWTHYKRSCFILGPGVATWSSAQHACSVLDGHLTSIRSKADMKWLWRFAGKQPFWIGLSGTPGQWSWADGAPLTFSRLKKVKTSGQQDPANSSHRCILAQDQKKWTPKHCTAESEHKYICSAPAQVNK